MPISEMDTAVVEEKLKTALAESDDEGVGQEVVAEGITRQGLGSVGSEKDKKGKPRWLVLVAGTLFWYKSQCLTNLKGELKLKDTVICKANNALRIMNGDKALLVLSFSDPAGMDEWCITLNGATTMDPGQPPVAIASTKTLNMAARVNKAVAGKVAVSGMGKAMAKASLNEEAKLLISSVKNLITLTYDSKTANTVENNIIKLFVKYHYLMADGQLEEDSWTAMDRGLREAFKWGVKITDNTQSGRVIPADTLTEWIGLIKKALRQVEKDLFGLLQPFVQAKTLNRIGVSFNILASDEFLMAVFNPSAVDKIQLADSESLTYAMERYLQFSW